MKAAISLALFLNNIRIPEGAVCIKNRICHIKPLMRSIKASEKLLKKALQITLAFLLAPTWPSLTLQLGSSEESSDQHHKHCWICRNPPLSYEKEIQTSKNSSSGHEKETLLVALPATFNPASWICFQKL